MIQRLRISVASVAALALLLAIGPASPAGATSPAAKAGFDFFPTQFPLPTGFLPEGVAIGVLPFAFFGSRADGDIYRVNLVTGKGTVFSQGPGAGKPSVGMKLDGRGRLFVAGGNGGDARVVNAVTGQILATFSFVTPPAATFVNDVVLTPNAAWFTDSLNPFLYKVPLGTFGALPDPSAVVKVPLSGAYQHQPGFNANGIARTPDGTALIIVHSPLGLLFRVDAATGVTTQVDLGGATVVSGDGLLLSGRTLFVVRNAANKVVVIRLNLAGTAGEVVDELTDPRFDVPTTVAAFGNRLYLPNARFGVPDPGNATYDAVAIPKP